MDDKTMVEVDEKVIFERGIKEAYASNKIANQLNLKGTREWLLLHHKNHMLQSNQYNSSFAKGSRITSTTPKLDIINVP